MSRVLLPVWSALFCAAVVSAETNTNVDFAELISTPAGIQRALERCDGNPAFEIALANWLEMAQPPVLEDRRAVRETSLRLLEDTTNVQLVFGLVDGLLRHALEDVKRDQTIVTELLARVLYTDIRKAIKGKTYKAKAIPVPVWGIAEDGTVTDERLARFLQSFLNLIEPGVSYIVRPYERTPMLSAGAVASPPAAWPPLQSVSSRR